MRVALLALLGPLILLLLSGSAVLGRPNDEQNVRKFQFDDLNIAADREALLTQRQKQKFKIATVSKEDDDYFDDDLSSVNVKDGTADNYLYTELSQQEVKKLAKKFFNMLVTKGPAAQLEMDLPPINPRKNHHSHHHHQSSSSHHSSSSSNTIPELFSGNNHHNGCMASPFSQSVHQPGCETKFILNRFCHGTCTSYYVPQMRSKKLKEIFQTYSVCRPTEVEHVQVKLECENGPVTREITRIKRCSCVEHDAPLPE